MSTVERDDMPAPTRFITLRDLAHVPNGGIQQSIIDTWVKSFQELSGKEVEDFPLTPLQQDVANHPEAFSRRESDQVMRGPNLVITGPTSAGKTLCAEMLMANHLSRAAHPIGCIYAVPLRALATEKWERFRSIFGSTQVYVSSSDYQEFDPLILNRRFRAVVVVYEKLYSWLTHSETAGRILRKTALFIFDELQMLSDPQRGAKLELILTFIRDRQKRLSDSEDSRYHSFRIVGLGPAGGALEEVTKWLDATRIDLPDEQRPVPLVQGYINLRGEMYYEPLPPPLADLQASGEFSLPKVKADTRDELTENFVISTLKSPTGKRSAVGEGKRILIYCATKTGAEAMAKKIAAALTRELGKRQSLDEETNKEIENLEGTDTLKILKGTIESGVGFHHGDLTLEERLLVERLFIGRRGISKLDVVVCTPTLAMGVNLPADYMLFSTTDTFRQVEYQSSGIITEPLRALEYKQFAGRAGRYRPDAPHDHHGVALFLTDKGEEEAQRDIVEGLIRGKIDPIQPALHRWPYGLVPLALGALAWEGSYFQPVFSPEQIKALFSETFAVHSRAFTQYKNKRYTIQEAAVKELQDISTFHPELVGRTPEVEFSLAGPGKVVAEQGIDIKTYEILEKLARSLPEILQHPFVLLEELVQATEVVRLYPTSIPEGFEAARLTRKLRSFFEERKLEGYQLGPIADELLITKYVPSDVRMTYLIRTVAAWLWMRGDKAEDITKSPYLPGIRHGAITTLTDQLSWFMGALDPLWSALEYQPAIESVAEDNMESWVKQHQWDIKRFELRLRYGVPEGLESVARLRVRGWHRERLVDLWQLLGGWEHPVELLDRSVQKVARNLRPLFFELKRSVRRRKWSDDPRDVLDLQVSLVLQAQDNYTDFIAPGWDRMIENLYLDKGAALIQVVHDVLANKPLQMNVTVEQEPLPDIVLTTGSSYAGVVVVDTSKDEVGWADIVRSAWSRKRPDGGTLDYLICICEKPISESIEQADTNTSKLLRVLSREAFTQLCARAVDDPDDKDIEEVGDLERTKRVPAVLLVRTFLGTPKSAVFRNAEDIDRALNEGGNAPRIINPERELIGGRSIKLPVKDESRQPVNLLGHQLKRIDEDLETLLADQETAEVAEWIGDARKLLPEQPVQCVALCIDLLEDWIEEVYEWKLQKSATGSFSDLIKRLVESKTLTPAIEHFTKIEGYRSNERSNERTVEVKFEGKSMWLSPKIPLDEAVLVVDELLSVGKWYLDQRREVEQSLLKILPEQLNSVLCAAFEQDSLEQMLMYKLNKRLFDLAPQGEKFPTIAFELIKVAEAEGWIPDLLIAAYETNPGNRKWQAFSQKFERLLEKWEIDERMSK